MTNILVELFSVKGLFVYFCLNTDPTTSTLCHSPKQQEGKYCQHFSCDLCMSTPSKLLPTHSSWHCKTAVGIVQPLKWHLHTQTKCSFCFLMPCFQHHPIWLLFFWEETLWHSPAVKVLKKYIRIKGSVNKVVVNSASRVTRVRLTLGNRSTLPPYISERKVVLWQILNY